MAKNQNPILLGKVGKGLNTIITVLPELQHRTKLDKNLKPPFSNPSTPPPSLVLNGEILRMGRWSRWVGRRGLYSPLEAFGPVGGTVL